MNPSTSVQDKNFKTSMTKLNLPKIKFLEEQNILQMEHEQLQNEKEKLCAEIFEYQALEFATRNAKHTLVQSMVQLREKTNEAAMECSNGSAMPNVDEIYSQIREGFELIRKADYNLNVWQDMIEPSQILYQHSNQAELRVKLCNIDPHGLIQKNGGSVTINAPQKCRFCVENDIDSILYKCGHNCCCLRCGNKMLEEKKKCPVCHSAIKSVVRLYIC